jgi:hypothetical protein
MDKRAHFKIWNLSAEKNILRHIHKNTIRISRQICILWSSWERGVVIDFFYSTQKKEEWISAPLKIWNLSAEKDILKHIHKNTIRISRQFYILWSSWKRGIAIALSQKLWYSFTVGGARLWVWFFIQPRKRKNR